MSKLPDDVVSKIEEQGELRDKEFEIRKARVQREFDKLKNNKVSTENIRGFNPEDFEFATNGENLIKTIYGGIKADRQILKNSVTFINDGLTQVIPFSRGSLYLMGGISGHGKSTTAANVSYPLWKEGKKILVISNEEINYHIYGRIACLDLQYDFNDWRNNKLSEFQTKQVDSKIPHIMQYVTVIGTDKQGLTDTIEGIKTVLEAYVSNSEYSCILIDFFQRIATSNDNPQMSRQEVLYAFKDYITTYITRAVMPVVLFTQLMPLPKDATDREFESRIKWCKGIYEAASVAIDILPKKKELKTYFFVEKDRFGRAGTIVECKFQSGKYVYNNPLADMEQKIEALVATTSKIS